MIKRSVARAAGMRMVTSTREQVMKTADILRAKGSDVITIGPDRPIQEAMSLLVNHNIGALVVFDGRLHGIITERDTYARRRQTSSVSRRPGCAT